MPNLSDSALVKFLEDETYSLLYSGDEFFSSFDRISVASDVRSMVDDYLRVRSLVGRDFSASNKSYFVSQFVSLGYDQTRANAFVTALISAKSKGYNFQFNPVSANTQTGKGVVTVPNMVITKGKKAIDDATDLPGNLLDLYKFAPYIGLALLGAYLYVSFGKKK